MHRSVHDGLVSSSRRLVTISLTSNDKNRLNGCGLVATETNPLLQLESFLPYRLAVLASIVSRGLAGIHERHDLGAVEWIVLMTLGEGGPMTATALGARNRMHKTRVSRAVTSLMRRELIL